MQKIATVLALTDNLPAAIQAFEASPRFNPEQPAARQISLAPKPLWPDSTE